jgi:hypothetical protein
MVGSTLPDKRKAVLDLAEAAQGVADLWQGLAGRLKQVAAQFDPEAIKDAVKSVQHEDPLDTYIKLHWEFMRMFQADPKVRDRFWSRIVALDEATGRQRRRW